MNKVSLFIITVIFFAACASPQEKKQVETTAAAANDMPVAKSYFKAIGDSLEIPAFEISINLSQKATDKLAAGKETIVVAAWFAGQPKDTTTKEYEESGDLFVASSQAELAPGATARFAGIRFPKSKYDSLADKDIRVLINVYSGRHSSPDNLLDCDILEDKMSAVKERKFVLKGKLIAETDSLP